MSSVDEEKARPWRTRTDVTFKLPPEETLDGLNARLEGFGGPRRWSYESLWMTWELLKRSDAWWESHAYWKLSHRELQAGLHDTDGPPRDYRYPDPVEQRCPEEFSPWIEDELRRLLCPEAVNELVDAPFWVEEPRERRTPPGQFHVRPPSNGDPLVSVILNLGAANKDIIAAVKYMRDRLGINRRHRAPSAPVWGRHHTPVEAVELLECMDNKGTYTGWARARSARLDIDPENGRKTARELHRRLKKAIRENPFRPLGLTPGSRRPKGEA